MIPKNTVCLWYDGTAEAAADFYAATFPDTRKSPTSTAPRATIPAAASRATCWWSNSP